MSFSSDYLNPHPCYRLSQSYTHILHHEQPVQPHCLSIPGRLRPTKVHFRHSRCSVAVDARPQRSLLSSIVQIWIPAHHDQRERELCGSRLLLTPQCSNILPAAALVIHYLVDVGLPRHAPPPSSFMSTQTQSHTIIIHISTTLHVEPRPRFGVILYARSHSGTLALDSV